MEVRGSMSEEEVEKRRGPKVLRTMSPRVQRSKGPKDQDISKSHSSMTLKKVHLVTVLKLGSKLHPKNLS